MASSSKYEMVLGLNWKNMEFRLAYEMKFPVEGPLSLEISSLVRLGLLISATAKYVATITNIHSVIFPMH